MRDGGGARRLLRSEGGLNPVVSGKESTTECKEKRGHNNRSCAKLYPSSCLHRLSPYEMRLLQRFKSLSWAAWEFSL
jgi:hypothetical protein